MWQPAFTFLHFRKPDTLCLVLGGDSFRYAVAESHEPAFSEAAIGSRWRDTKKLHTIGEENPGCHRWTEREWVRLFDGRSEINTELLNRFCASLRKRVSRHWGRKAPVRLLLTGRPDLMNQIAPLLADAAEQSGFRSARPVAEHECLVRAAGAQSSGALLVDVGHVGTRIYDGAVGQTDGPDVAAGQSMQKAIGDIVLRRHNLIIGSRSGLRMLRQLDTPANWPISFKGRDATTQLPREAAMERELVLEAVGPAIAAVAQTCERAIAATSAANGSVHRVLLAGGCAESQELQHAIESRLQRPAICLTSPAEASLRGLCSLAMGAIAR